MEKITTVLFDLDGTLIPFDQKEFIESYLYLIAKKFVPRGYDKDILIKALWDGTGNMVKNDGKVSNRDVFKSTFAELMEKEYDEMEDDFMEFYEKEFDDVKQTLQEEVDRAEFIKTIKDKGLKVVLATNPIFPKAAVQTRLNWIGLSVDDFDYVTTFENIGSKPEESIMVGNNALEDMIVSELGVRTFLIIDNLENPEKIDVNKFENGNFDDIANKVLNIL